MAGGRDDAVWGSRFGTPTPSGVFAPGASSGTPPTQPSTLPSPVPAGSPEGTLVRDPPAGAAAEAAEVDPLIGTTVGSFKLVRRLGKGGMGSVYLGEQTVIGSKVAVKFLHESLSTNAGLVARFYSEARSVNLIGHENIVNIFDMNLLPPSRYYLVMEYLDGQTLASLATGPVGPEIAIPILTQVCDALQAAHAAGVIHRDLKPENIFLVKRGRTEHFVKLVDFGIAKLFADRVGEETSAGMIIGTPEYMAPEQASGEKVDGRADIYAVGVIMYLLATGRLPFQGGGLAGLLIAHRDQVPPAPNEVNALVPVGWSRVIMRALAKRPQDRYQNASDLREALEHALDDYLTRPRQAPASIPTPLDLASPTPSTPKPAQERRPASFVATVHGLGGQLLGELTTVDLSKGGAFFCLEGKLPPIFSRVNLALHTPGGELSCAGDVVRHVTPEQAKAWSMSPGFGVQFVETTPELKDAIGRVLAGLPLVKAPAAAPTTPKPAMDDPVVDSLLDHYRKRFNGDHYAILSAPPDADFADLHSRCREALKELEELKQRGLSPKQEGQLTTILDKLKAAQEALGTPSRRAEYDGLRGNYRGVARCLAAGLTVTELEMIRKRVLETRRANEGKAHVAFVTGNAWESRGQLPLALEQYEQALTLDPLNLRLHQRYWGLRKRQAGKTG